MGRGRERKLEGVKGEERKERSIKIGGEKGGRGEKMRERKMKDCNPAREKS